MRLKYLNLAFFLVFQLLINDGSCQQTTSDNKANTLENKNITKTNSTTIVSKLKDSLENVLVSLDPVVKSIDNIIDDINDKNDNGLQMSPAKTEASVSKVYLHSLEENVVTVTPSNTILKDRPAAKVDPTPAQNENELRKTSPDTGVTQNSQNNADPIYTNIAKLLSSLNENQLEQLYSNIVKELSMTTISDDFLTNGPTTTTDSLETLTTTILPSTIVFDEDQTTTEIEFTSTTSNEKDSLLSDLKESLENVLIKLEPVVESIAKISEEKILEKSGQDVLNEIDSSTTTRENLASKAKSFESDEGLDPIVGNIAELLSSLTEEQLKKIYSSISKTRESNPTTLDDRTTTDSVTTSETDENFLTTLSSIETTTTNTHDDEVENKTTPIENMDETTTLNIAKNNSKEKLDSSLDILEKLLSALSEKKLNEFYASVPELTTKQAVNASFEDQSTKKSASYDKNVIADLRTFKNITDNTEQNVENLNQAVLNARNYSAETSTINTNIIVVEEIPLSPLFEDSASNLSVDFEKPNELQNAEAAISDLKNLTNKTIDEIVPVIDSLKDILQQIKEKNVSSTTEHMLTDSAIETTTSFSNKDESTTLKLDPLLDNLAKLLSTLTAKQLKEFYANLSNTTNDDTSKKTSDFGVIVDMSIVNNKTEGIQQNVERMNQSISHEIFETSTATEGMAKAKFVTFPTNTIDFNGIPLSPLIEEDSNKIKNRTDLQNAKGAIEDLRKLANETIEEIEPVIDSLNDVIQLIKDNNISSVVEQTATVQPSSQNKLTYENTNIPNLSNRFDNRRAYGRNPALDLNAHKIALENGVNIDKNPSYTGQNDVQNEYGSRYVPKQKISPTSPPYRRFRPGFRGQSRNNEESRIIKLDVPPNSDLADIATVKNSIISSESHDPAVQDDQKTQNILKKLEEEIAKAEKASADRKNTDAVVQKVYQSRIDSNLVNNGGQNRKDQAETSERKQEWRRGRVRYQDTVPLLSEEREFDGKGYYKFSYESSDGLSHTEEGHLKNFDSGESGEVVVGSYSWTDADGKVYKVDYTADENGFIPRGDHLPTPPPTPAYILRSLERLKDKEKNPPRNIRNRGSKKYRSL